MIVPSFFFTPAAIEKRKPLSKGARRAGWIGCNILLREIAQDGKILMISNKAPVPANQVRSRYDELRPFSQLRASLRGWTLDVFRMIRQLGKKQFSLNDIYFFESALSDIYPGNKNVRPKIRQQLQVLRDFGFLQFLGNGEYMILK